MFDKSIELTYKKDYEDRLRQVARANYATRIQRAVHPRVSFLARLGAGVVRLRTAFQRQAYLRIKREEAAR